MVTTSTEAAGTAAVSKTPWRIASPYRVAGEGDGPGARLDAVDLPAALPGQVHQDARRRPDVEEASLLRPEPLEPDEDAAEVHRPPLGLLVVERVLEGAVEGRDERRRRAGIGEDVPAVAAAGEVPGQTVMVVGDEEGLGPEVGRVDGALLPRPEPRPPAGGAVEDLFESGRVRAHGQRNYTREASGQPKGISNRSGPGAEPGFVLDVRPPLPL